MLQVVPKWRNFVHGSSLNSHSLHKEQEIGTTVDVRCGKEKNKIIMEICAFQHNLHIFLNLMFQGGFT